MAKFRFTLDPLLRMRRRAERDRQQQLAKAERERIEIEDEVRRMQERITDERNELRHLLSGAGGAVDLAAARLQAAASLNAVARTQQAALRLAGAHKRVEVARSELLAAAKQRRAVEILREQRFEEWRSGEARREGALLDELATVRSARSEA